MKKPTQSVPSTGCDRLWSYRQKRFPELPLGILFGATMIEDENVRRIREVRKRLLEEHGGFDNYFRYLQKLDREFFSPRKSRSRKLKGNKGQSAA